MLVTDTFIKKRIVSCLVIGITMFSSMAVAKTYTLDQGQSQLIETNKRIDTIFVSSPTVADYEILDDNSFMIYAKSEGKSEVVAFGEDGKPLTSDVVHVNMLINNISDANQQIRTRFPNSNLSVKKVGKAYVIEGRAGSETESEEVSRIVGEALGSSATVTETKFGDEKVSFLDKYSYQGVVNNSSIEDTAQINVKLTVVEVNKSFSDALGINWSNLALVDGALNFGSIKGSASFTGGQGAIGFLSATGVSMFINALDKQTNGQILAEPNISVLSGETANILVGGEIPLFSEIEKGWRQLFIKSSAFS